jgi:hypothetical protein
MKDQITINDRIIEIQTRIATAIREDRMGDARLIYEHEFLPEIETLENTWECRITEK